MQISKSVNFLNMSDIVVKYYDVEHEPGDNHIQRYNDYKITIHLSDGLVGVLNAQMLGGKKGDILLYAPDEIHFGRFLSSGVYRYLHFLIPIDLCNKLSASYPSLKNTFDSSKPNRINCIRGMGKYRDTILSICENIVENLKKDRSEDFNIISDIMQILSICAQLYENQDDNESIESFTSYTRFAMKYMNEHYSEKITIDEIAKKAGCSTTYLSKIFKKDTDKSIYTYLTEYRISKSTILLKKGFNVTETCYAVGFGDCSSFIRTFKKAIGVSPHKYKNLN